MVRTVFAICFVLFVAIPALAQEDFPRIQTSMGYANISFPDLFTGESGHHHGFANQTSFNLTKTYGLDNYMGIYSLGQGVTMISDLFGGKIMYRAAKFVPYGLAGNLSTNPDELWRHDRVTNYERFPMTGKH